MGALCAPASSLVTHNSFPVLESNARKRLSIVAPINTRPLAVAREPPRLGAPVFCFPSGKLSTIPRGTCQAISPVLTLTAISRPQGGFWQGMLRSGFQKRPTGPKGLVLEYGVREPSLFFTILPIPPRS